MTGGPPVVRASSVLIAGGMAVLAGATNVYGLARLGDLFVSFMSGNTTMLGVAIGNGQWLRVGLLGGVIGAFVLGAAAGAVLKVVAGRYHAPAVAWFVAIMLLVPIWAPQWTVWALGLAMGTLNCMMSHLGAASVSLTYVTGTLVKLGQGVGQALCGRPGGWSWLWEAAMWLSLLSGAISATLIHINIGIDTFWPLPMLALTIGFATLIFKPV